MKKLLAVTFLVVALCACSYKAETLSVKCPVIIKLSKIEIPPTIEMLQNEQEDKMLYPNHEDVITIDIK